MVLFPTSKAILTMFATATTSRSTTSKTFISREPRSDKKFCGVCKKKGLAESVYTSHFTKSVPGEKGIVVCPTILSATCSYCNQRGHWANEDYCSAMKKDRRDAEYARKEYSNYKPVAVRATAPVAEDFPALPSAKGAALVAAPTQPLESWAEMAKKPAREIAAIKENSKQRARYYYDTERPVLTAEEAEAIKILEERIRQNPWAYTETEYSDDEEGCDPDEVLEDDSEW